MTPKEKAKELVNKYWGKGITNDKEIAKQCALIAVKEILSNNTDISKHDYWIEVRTEIENNFSGQSKQLPICKCENTERIEVGSGSWNIHCKDCGKNW